MAMRGGARARLASVLLLALLALALGGSRARAEPRTPPRPAQDTTILLPYVLNETPATLIAFAGHGRFFARGGAELTLDDELVRTIQEAILAEVRAAPLDPIPQKVAESLKAMETLLASPQTTADEAVYLRAATIGALLDYSTASIVAEYAWRNGALAARQVAGRPNWQTTINPDVLALIGTLNPFAPLPSTPYIDACRAQDVPIPPDWDQSGIDWKYQGELTVNLLRTPTPDFAGVWTWADPEKRGACIALPRGSGERGSLAGIICQSATTGRACFWDNQLRSDPSRSLGWSEQALAAAGLDRLVITDLVDGSNATAGGVCVSCHQGDNVFILTPSDPTWLKVMEGRLEGGASPNWTVRVEASSDNRGGHPRYVPIPGPTERPAWSVGNAFTGARCGNCHELPSTFVMGKWSQALAPMPPPCDATAPADDCYTP